MLYNYVATEHYWDNGSAYLTEYRLHTDINSTQALSLAA